MSNLCINVSNFRDAEFADIFEYLGDPAQVLALLVELHHEADTASDAQS